MVEMAARKTFRRFTLQEYIDQMLRPVVGKVRFSEIHVHGTWRPTIADYRRDGGLKLVQSMWRFHTGVRGFSDIAQHATIDPDGYIWEGRSLLVPPASASGYNDPDNDGVHPFMFEMIGNFDVGCEKFEGPQLETVAGMCRAIMTLWNLGPEKIRFHREFTNQKTCPGSGISKPWFIAKVMEYGTKEDDETLELSQTQRKMLVTALKDLHERGLFSDKTWIEKAEKGTLTVSELAWLNTIILTRK